MTREELVLEIEMWGHREDNEWRANTIELRDKLQFALWWYGRSTEAEKTSPSWPGADYIASLLGRSPSYLTSLDDAKTLIPPDIWTEIHAGTRRTGPIVLYGRRDSGAKLGSKQARTLALTLCIVAISARMEGVQ